MDIFTDLIGQGVIVLEDRLMMRRQHVLRATDPHYPGHLDEFDDTVLGPEEAEEEEVDHLINTALISVRMALKRRQNGVKTA